MTDIVTSLTEILNTYPQLAGIATFVISAAESIAIIGTIVPGSITMTAIGVLAGAGVIPLWETLFWATLGAIVGDGISYWIGHHFKDRLPHIWPFKHHPSLLITGEKFFHKHGSMSVFIGRFVGPVRALVPLVAGMLGMRPLPFLAANVASAIGWAPAYMLPGILLGAASLELPPDIALHVMMTFMLFILFALLCLWFIYKILQLLHHQIEQFKQWLWNNLKQSRYFSTATVLLQHYDDRKTHGQLTLALYFIGISIALFVLALYVHITGPSNIIINDALYHLFRGIRTPLLDNLMLSITLLGQKQVALFVIAVFFTWLMLKKRWWTAFHVLALGTLAAGGVFVIKHVVAVQRPWGIFNSPESYSMPSGHTTLATTVFMGLAFLIAASIRPSRRWFIYTCAAIIAFAVGVSRIYLGAHWFTDVLAAWLLSIAVLMIVIISYRHRRVIPLNPGSILIVSFASFALAFSVYYSQHATKLLADYQRINPPVIALDLNTWWQKNDAIPAYRTSLFGFPSQRINIEWTGSLEKIHKTLAKEGWTKPPTRDWISTIHRVADISSTEYLPMISPQYLDNKPSLTMTRSIDTEKNGKRLLVIRLWDANRIMQETEQTLWVGIVSIVPRSYSWLLKNDLGDIGISPYMVFPSKTAFGEWEWKIMTMKIPAKTTTIDQKIMLIRKNKSIHKKL